MKVDTFKPLINLLPEVEIPKQKPVLKIRLKWTLFALLFFALLGIIQPVGVAPAGGQAEWLGTLQLIMASKIGTLATLGIGPIVMASIILQLLSGAGLFKIDPRNPEDKRNFQGLQKLVAIAFCFFEGAIYVSSGFVPTVGMMNMIIVIFQLAFGAILLMYLDEIVSKYGIGSGVGLFIAAGVSFGVFWQLFSWVSTGPGTYVGHVPTLLQGLMNGEIITASLFPIIFTILVFLIVVYAESMKIEIPLTFGRIRGFGARYPLKFLYVSNIPVILAAALFANVELWGTALDHAGLPILGSFGPNNQPLPGGAAYYLRTPYGYLGTPEAAMLHLTNVNDILHMVIFTIAMIILCVVFGKFWVQMSGMDSKNVAGQLQQTGLHVPGFRRDPRVIEGVFDRYIPMVTILGSAAVGVLAVAADLTGALGTGTGILLTVGILYKIYEELAAQSVFETMPGLGKMLGA